LAVACASAQATPSKPLPEPAPAEAGAANAAASGAAGSTSSAQAGKPSTEAATTAAESWLALVDAAKYRESWQAAAPLLQSAISAEDWSSAAGKARAPFGKLLSRQVRSAVYRTALPGAPQGKFVIIQFDSAFEQKASAVETVTPMQGEDGSWKVSGYFIK
jgi:hypothetical protein